MQATGHVRLAGATVALMAALTIGVPTAFAAPPETEVLLDTARGTIPTPAVERPVQVGDITYVPAVVIAGSAEPPIIGTVRTGAVTKPVTIGAIRYMPLQ